MSTSKKRGLLASAAALVTAATLALGGSVVASAATVTDMPSESGVIITKLEQPSSPGDRATGEQLPDLAGYTPINGVTFEAYAVPVVDGDDNPIAPGTNEWQEAVVDMTVGAAQTLVGGSPTAVRTGVTANGGVIIWETGTTGNQGASLDRGLYLIRETAAPVGVIPSGDFLLAVPLTNPSDLDKWLTTIYVYPKNGNVSGVKTVVNAEDYVVGNTVTWTINLNNPSAFDAESGNYLPATRFEILDTLDNAFLTTTVGGVNVNLPGGLLNGTDYTVTLTPGTGASPDNTPVGSTLVEIKFTEDGLDALAAARNSVPPVTNVSITIDTVVQQVGVIENSARFFSALSQTVPKDIPGEEVKYGNIKLKKESTDEEVENLSGAEFRVYLTEAAARAKSNLPYDADTHETGYLTTKENSTGLWVTNIDGEVVLGGFRYSGSADGDDFDDSDLRYQYYWLVETKALSGHQLLGEPIQFVVDSHDGLKEYEVINSKDGGFLLPLTGGTGTLLLTLGGIALLALVLLVVVRRRRETEVSAE